jgi:hypothetical protein
MHLQQADFEFSIPVPTLTDSVYYWTMTFIYDLDNPPVGITSLQQISGTLNLGMTSQTTRTRLQRQEPPYSGTFISKASLPPQHGLLPARESWTLFDSVRMTYYADGRAVGYKRWRVPLGEGDIIDGQLSSAMFNQFHTTVAPGLLTAKICSRFGEPIDQIVVSPRVHQWQWRDGTKRRNRHVIVIP